MTSLTTTINKAISSFLAALLLTFLVSACDAETLQAPAAETGEPSEFIQWKLPKRLREISGLALTPDERLLAITDERAVVYELDYSEGKVVKSYWLGDPIVMGDFEGIAVITDTVWLLTSDGLLYATADGPDAATMRYRKFDTGLGGYCEFEGLGQDSQAGILLLACKETINKKDDLMIFEWSVSRDRIEPVRNIRIPESEIKDRIDKKRISPSGITIDPQTGERVLIAARQDALVRLTADGGLSEAIILKKKKRHKQAEGIEITADGRMLIADEGRDGRARLAVYPASTQGNKNNE